jgi:hypothetical protein
MLSWGNAPVGAHIGAAAPIFKHYHPLALPLGIVSPQPQQQPQRSAEIFQR